MSEFKKILRRLRIQKNVKQIEIARYIGYGYTAISNYERGINEPSLDVLIKIADFFNVPTDYLLGLTRCKIYETPDFFKEFENLTEEEKDSIMTIMILYNMKK